ncbi:MAG: hypothetical protein QMD03_05050 [Syntrophales bacterium]|nr:hypothetical protein [Syntrophales bacterium]
MSTGKPWYATVKLPPGKVHQLDTDLNKLFAGLENVGIGPRYVGEIRKGQWYAELGGPKHEYKSYIFVEVVGDPEEVMDGRVEVIGPELDELAPETSLPFAAHIKAWGPQLSDDLLEFVERGAVMGFLFTEGWGLVGARTNMWLRVSKEVKPRMSWLKMAQIMRANMISLCPLVEKVEIKLEVADVIPEEVYDKIATEEDVVDPADLEVWLREKKHPVVEKYWKDSKPVPLKIPMPNHPWEDEMWEEK